MSDDHKWRNLETKTAEAIASLLFTDDPVLVVAALSRLDEVLRWVANQPEIALGRAAALQRLLRAPADFDLGIAAPLAVGERHAWLAVMPDEAKTEIASELVSFLRFVCHRGAGIGNA